MHASRHCQYSPLQGETTQSHPHKRHNIHTSSQTPPPSYHNTKYTTTVRYSVDSEVQCRQFCETGPTTYKVLCLQHPTLTCTPHSHVRNARWLGLSKGHPVVLEGPSVVDKRFQDLIEPEHSSHRRTLYGGQVRVEVVSKALQQWREREHTQLVHIIRRDWISIIHQMGVAKTVAMHSASKERLPLITRSIQYLTQPQLCQSFWSLTKYSISYTCSERGEIEEDINVQQLYIQQTMQLAQHSGH